MIGIDKKPGIKWRTVMQDCAPIDYYLVHIGRIV